MVPMKIAEDLRPLSDLKAHASAVVKQAQESGRPVVLTRHGRGVAVVLSVEAFEELQASARREELQAAVDAGEKAYAAGEWVDNNEVEKELLAWERDGEP